MDVSTIAFLVLLGGTPAEHIISMPSYDDCQRAAETLSLFECLDADQFEAKLKETKRIQSDLQPASGDIPPSRPTVDPAQTESAVNGMPSALRRQARNALYPLPDTQLTPRESRPSGVILRRLGLNG